MRDVGKSFKNSIRFDYRKICTIEERLKYIFTFKDKPWRTAGI